MSTNILQTCLSNSATSDPNATPAITGPAVRRSSSRRRRREGDDTTDRPTQRTRISTSEERQQVRDIIDLESFAFRGGGGNDGATVPASGGPFVDPHGVERDEAGRQDAPESSGSHLCRGAVHPPPVGSGSSSREAVLALSSAAFMTPLPQRMGLEAPQLQTPPTVHLAEREVNRHMRTSGERASGDGQPLVPLPEHGERSTLPENGERSMPVESRSDTRPIATSRRPAAGVPAYIRRRSHFF